MCYVFWACFARRRVSATLPLRPDNAFIGMRYSLSQLMIWPFRACDIVFISTLYGLYHHLIQPLLTPVNVFSGTPRHPTFSEKDARGSVSRRLLRHFRNKTAQRMGFSGCTSDVAECRDFSSSVLQAPFRDSRFPVLSKIA